MIYIINCNNENKIVSFNILNNISEHVTLVQFMDSIGNVNHAVSVVGSWIFDSKYKKYLQFPIEYLNLIFLVLKKRKYLNFIHSVL